MELVTEKPEAWATRAGSRDSASAVVSMTRVLEDWAPAAGGRLAVAGSASRRMASRSLGSMCGVTPIPHPGAWCKDSQQILAGSILSQMDARRQGRGHTVAAWRPVHEGNSAQLRTMGLLCAGAAQARAVARGCAHA